MEEIASGGQATVYRAWDTRTGQVVALKVSCTPTWPGMQLTLSGSTGSPAWLQSHLQSTPRQYSG